MKTNKKEFLKLRRRVITYNKALIYTFVLYMVYAFAYSIHILDCGGIDYYTFSGDVTVDMISCNSLSSGVLTFYRNNNLLICCLFLIAAIIFLVLQKLALLKINKLSVKNEEKVLKYRHTLFTLLLGYTGIHKFQTENRVIGHIFLVNFVLFLIAWFIKTFFESTYTSYLILYCMFEFGLLFLIGIIILNIIDAVFSFISEKDSDDKIFA